MSKKMWMFKLLLLLIVGATAAPPKWHDLDESYSFEQFVVDFDKVYTDDEEYTGRRAIFAANLRTIMEHNGKKPKAGHVLGVNEFMDRRLDEIFTGYDKAPKRLGLRSSSSQLPLVIDPVSDLPAAIDWRTKGITTPVKSQGMCGSCWAFASTAVLESHIALQTGTLFELSEQELVSCAPNPQHCGGYGGCTGSTAEIAYNFVAKHGIVQEWNFGYDSFHGQAVNCSLTPGPSSLRGADSMFADSVASIAGYASLESNDYTTLMNAVAKLGPVAVSVACHPWIFYQSGVFYAPLNSTSATDINHLVVLEGYGTDQETGEDFWLIRNSWGPMWGEGGYIRLKRVDPASLDDPESDCGMDVTPADGEACTRDEDGKDIVPPPVKICGTSGILYDSVVPLGGHLVVKTAASMPGKHVDATVVAA